MARIKQDKDALPLYGSVTGITLPGEQIHVALGVALRPGLFDTFSTPMMGFAEPSSGGHHTRALGCRGWRLSLVPGTRGTRH